MAIEQQGIETRSETSGDMVIDWDVAVPMDDGVVLRADVFRPRAGEPCPVLLSYGPYGKGLAIQEGYPEQWESLTREHPEVLEGSSGRYQVWEVADPEKWVPDGYVCVRVDARGAGRSPGYLSKFSARERRDLYECIEWAADQPWSTGKVGLAGISYFAINQWHVAGLRPPHLAAICPWEGAADAYRDMTHHGGIPCSFWGNWQHQQVATVQHGVGERGFRNPNNGELVSGPPTLSEEELAANRLDLRQAVYDHPLDDDFYRERSADWSLIEVPLLSAANWGGHGLHARGNFAGFTESASRQKWLEVHGLEHWTHFYTDYGRALQKRFFDHFLKDEDNGWDSHPPVLLQIRHVDRFEPRSEREWPLARTRWTKLYLDPARGALLDEPPERTTSAEFAALEDHIVCATEPFATETEITGPLAAKLFVSSSTSDADLFLVVHLLDPDGREVTFPGAVDPHSPIAQGWLRASHRKLDPERSTPYRPYHPHDEVQPLTPGEVYEVDVEIWPTCIVVPAGYRIALSVRGTDYEYEGEHSRMATFANELTGSGPFVHDDPVERPPEVYGGTTVVHGGGAHRSYLLVPVVPG